VSDWSSSITTSLPPPPPLSPTNQTFYVNSGCGYIGSFTVLALLKANYDVIIVDNLYNSQEEVINRIELITGKRPQFYNMDITDEKALDNVFSKHPKIDSVIHFAALKVHLHSQASHYFTH